MTVMGTISFLKLNSNDVFLLLVRNYSNSAIPSSFKTIDLSLLSSDSEKVFSRKNFWRRPKMELIKKVDDFVQFVIVEPFHLYAPHLAHPLWTIMYTNSICEGFSYIQEGVIPLTTTYVTRTPLKGLLKNFIYDFMTNGRVWYYRPWYLRDKIIDQSRIDSYATNNRFFSYLPAKTNIIKWKTPPEDYNINFEDKHMIFIFDAYVAHGIMKEKDYLQMCKSLIDKMASKFNYLKFHPGQSKKEVEEIKNYFLTKKLCIQILSNSTPFEYVIMTKKNLKITGYGSSLLFLAHDYGHEVFCRDDDLLKFKTYRQYRKNFGAMSFAEYTRGSVHGKCC